MKMAELAQRSGLSVATIKFYIREGLVPSGERTNVNQAAYSESHVTRLRLIRALTQVARLSLEQVREVLSETDEFPTLRDAMGYAQDLVIGEVTTEPEYSPTAVATLEAAVKERKREIERDGKSYASAVRAIEALELEGVGEILAAIPEYAKAADEVARIDLSAMATIVELDALDDTIRSVVVGLALRDPLMRALTLLAQHHHQALM
jgi:DNA-binding transcriptional MerR regulator